MPCPPPHPNLEGILAGLAPVDFDAGEDARIAEILMQRRMAQCWRPGSNMGLQGIYGTDHLDVFLTHEQLGEDIRFLFDLLRHSYAGYRHFGGDDAFLPIRDAMLERLAGMANPLQVSSYLNDLILPALRGLIADSHFRIQGVTLGAPDQVLYMNGEFILRRDGSGFVTEIDGGIHRVLEVAHGKAWPEGGILPTLTAEGEFAWAFGLVMAGGPQGAVEIAVLLENSLTGESHSRMVNLQRVPAAAPRPRSPMIVTRELGGVTVLENRGLTESSTDDYVSFFRSGYELRDRPVLVMDLHGNGGGRDSHPRDWVRIYTGHEPSRGLFVAISSRPQSKASVELWEFDIPYYISVMHRELMAIRELRAMARGLGTPQREGGPSGGNGLPPQVPIPNESLVIVLTDNNIGSSGELFVGYLRQLENVLFVGTNTRGALVSGGLGRTSLPYSGLDIMFGLQLGLRPDLSQFEGLGFKPDLWVPPGESLERVLRFVERYGLLQTQP